MPNNVPAEAEAAWETTWETGDGHSSFSTRYLGGEANNMHPAYAE